MNSVQTLDHQVHQDAIYVLTKVYQIATAQIDKATRRNIGSTVSQYLSSCRQYIRLSKSVPTDIKPVKPKQLEMHRVEPISNGILRAHVVKAEACLQIAILYLLQETVTGYVKCGLNLRRGKMQCVCTFYRVYILYHMNISLCKLQHCLGRI